MTETQTGGDRPTDDAANRVSNTADENQSLDAKTRETVLERDDYRCQTCGRRAPSTGGLATLEIHHIERDPEGMGVHAPSNLTTLCRRCHGWVHQQSSPDDSPVELSDEDVNVLLAQDVEILEVLAESGPLQTGEIRGRLTADLSVPAVRERLWVLMGLDELVSSRSRQIVDKDLETGLWGLAEQVEVSSRGHVPDDRQLLLQRMEDEQVRRALENGVSRETVQEVFELSRKTTFNKEKRARAFGFPLDAFYGRGRRSDTDEDDDDAGEDAGGRESMDVGTGRDGERDVETWSAMDPRDAGAVTADELLDESDTRNGNEEPGVVRDRVQSAIDALESVDDAL